jgi:hypothetical protein
VKFDGGVYMKTISVYDIEAEKLEEFADRNDTTIAEVIEALMDYIDEVKFDNNWK